MKKTLIALAALAATGAFAQSSVTLYGRVDVGYANQVNSSTVNGVTTESKLNGVTSHNSVSSYWGIQGTEDLGGGLKANFKFEQDLFPATGATGSSGADSGFVGQADRYTGTGVNGGAGTFDRTSLVGLSGNFGRLDLGRDYLPTFSLAAATDVFGQSYLTTVGLAASVGSTVARQVIYTTPNFSGFTGKISIGNTDTTSGATDAIARNNNLSGIYSNGPLYVGLGYGVRETVTATTAKDEMTILGAAYDFGAVRLVGNYITTKATASNTSTDTTQTETNIGLTAPFGAVTAIAQVGRNTYSSSVAGNVGDRSGNDWAIGADYALSKRTTAFVKTGVTNKLEGTIAGVQNDGKRTVTSIGIRHTF
jgi:predicted porin